MYHNPVTVRFGWGLAGELRRQLERPVLVVCGRSGRFPELCREEEDWRCFAEVEPNPSPETAARAAVAASGVGTVMGLGGGSALDVARLAGGRRLVQVPTTAGSGSEVTPFASLWSGGRKSSVVGPFADLAVVDPSLCESLTPELTLTTGLDAVGHALEALWGRHHNPVSDVLAEAALDLSRAHLAPCVKEPTREHREALSRAATLAGMALSSTRSAAAHALSYPLTGHHNVPHGLAVGLFCRALLPLMKSERAALWQPAQGLFDELEVDWRLSAYGVTAGDFDRIIADASASNRLANHPVELDLRALLEGML